MSNPIPTQAEIEEALAVIARATGHRQTFSAAQTRKMSKEEIADALERNPAAFDSISEVES